MSAPDTREPVVSVVVSTFRRRDRIGNLVAALERQRLPASDFEVVIVDDGSDDGTYDELRRLAETSPCRIVPLRSDVNRGPAVGRNLGWRQARGDIIAFTDDDCIPDPRWLEAGLAQMSRGDVVIVGHTKPNPDQIAKKGPFSRTLKVTDTRFLQTCNVFYRRADLEAVGGFDESIRRKGGEDTDLGWRVADLGRELLFADDVVVLHDISPSSFRAALREAAGWYDIPRVVKAHPKRARAQLPYKIFWKRSHPPALAAILGISASVGTRSLKPMAATLPFVYWRMVRQPVARRRGARAVLLPPVLLLDAVEIATMIRGSIRHRTFIL